MNESLDKSDLIAMTEDRVAIVIDKLDEVSAGGIVLPTNRREKPDTGIIVSIGPGRWIDEIQKRSPMFFKAGQRVAIQKYASQPLELEDGSEVAIVRQTEIMGVLPAKIVREKLKPQTSCKEK